jgi:hypothetical protein
VDLLRFLGKCLGWVIAAVVGFIVFMVVTTYAYAHFAAWRTGRNIGEFLWP